ncbi:MAG: phosphotransferase family protein [Acidimicrobiia bacterium]
MVDALTPAQPEEHGTKSTRDAVATRAALESWLRTKEHNARIVEMTAPDANGMSSETLLFEAEWDVDGAPQRQRLVARVAPYATDVPVFPSYDLEMQFRVIEAVAAAGTVPVPIPRWLELDASVLGQPFFIMDRVDGRVPPDVMPYTFGSWLTEASAADQQHLQNASVRTLAAIHAIPVSENVRAHLERSTGGTTPLVRDVQHWRKYYEWVRGADRYPLLEAGFDWLTSNWPVDEGEAVLTWGDARIGNMMFDGFDPVAVLDWEMATVAPRGVDVGWMSFLHTFFQDITEVMQMPGLPNFMRLDDVIASYESAANVTLTDMNFYEVYAALRHGIIMARTHQRRVHFGEAEPVANPDDAVMHGARLAAMIS